MVTMFKPATRFKLRGRIAIDGPAGSGKTFTALRAAFATGKKVAIISTESGAVQKYLGLAPDGIPWHFDICELRNFSPSAYTEAILNAGQGGYDVLIIDSLSHAWEGEGGTLDLVSRSSDKNKFTAWKDATPMHNRMVQAILHSPCHVIVTMRSKTEYVMEPDANGKQVPRKVGMAPIQRQGMEYEFDLYCSMDWDHVLRVSKSRCPEMDGLVVVKPSASSFSIFTDWLNDGSDAPAEMFACTDADLARFQKTQDRISPPTAEELMARAAKEAEKSGDSNGNCVAGSTHDDPSANNAACTAEQRAEICRLFDALNLDEKQRAGIMESRHVKALRQLTASQADELVAKLNAKLSVVKQSSTTKAETNGATGETQADIPGPEQFTAETNGPASETIVVEIRRLIPEIGDKALADSLVAHLKAAGKKLTDLTQIEAVELKQALEARNLAEFFARSLAAKEPAKN